MWKKLLNLKKKKKSKFMFSKLENISIVGWNILDPRGTKFTFMISELLKYNN